MPVRVEPEMTLLTQDAADTLACMTTARPADPPNHFDEPVAARYDGTTGYFAPKHLDLESGFLAELAGPGGSALELAIGTGRIAIPLAQRGIRVSGIDLSPAMVDRLRADPLGAGMSVTIGDMTQAAVEGQFDLVYLVFNTIGNVTTQAGQAAVFANASRHLRPGGAFVVENLIPDVRGLGPAGRFRVFGHTDQHVGIDEYDTATQQLWSHHYAQQADGSYRRSSIPFRYLWPAEMDLMAAAADLHPAQRWAWWDRSSFAESSGSAVSVWTTQEC